MKQIYHSFRAVVSKIPAVVHPLKTPVRGPAHTQNPPPANDAKNGAVIYFPPLGQRNEEA